MSNQRRSRVKRPSVISLFSGCGGLDLGLACAGYKTKIFVEVDAECQESLRRNFVGCRIAEPSDVTAVDPSDLLRQAGLRRRSTDLLVGGPPCQPYSKSALWVNGKRPGFDDPRAQTLLAYFEIVDRALPKVVLLENVSGFAGKGDNDAWLFCLKRFKTINRRNGTKYLPQLIFVNAAGYGVPQLRGRIFIIAHRDGKRFEMPAPSFGDVSSGSIEAYRTAWDAIGDLERRTKSRYLSVSGKWAALLATIPEGQNYLWHTTRGGGTPLFGYRTRYWSFLLKLAKHRPAWTIQASPGPSTGPFHWRNRRLSPRELARLQTFPDSFRLPKRYSTAHSQIGNAIPPLLGELFGLEIRRQFFGHRVRRKLSLQQPKRKKCPPPEVAKQLPCEFAAIVPPVFEHPGPGKGPGAMKRRAKRVA